MLILLISLFIIKKIIIYPKQSLKNLKKLLMEQEFQKHIKEIELKNEQFENNTLTTKFVQKRIEEINSTFLKNNITFNESNYANFSQKEYSLEEVGKYADDFRAQNLTEINISNFSICSNPKISIIVPVYNLQKEILYLHKRIQEQSLKDIEIIYIDDWSNDNSYNFIKQLQKKDQRIILLKNKKNKGPFYSRNKAALFANGEYIQFMDGDDLILENILEKIYIIAKKKNIDVVQYKAAIKYKKYTLLEEKIRNNIVYQPELSNLLYYGKGYLVQTVFYIFNKIIKTDIYLKSMLYMGDELLKQDLYFNEDIIQLFCIFRNANTFIFVDDIAYIKLPRLNNAKTLFNNYHNASFANRILHDNFIEVKFLFNKTENNGRDKAICAQFLKMVEGQYHPILRNVTEGYELFDEVYDILLNSHYFSDSQKKTFENLKNLMMTNRNK